MTSQIKRDAVVRPDLFIWHGAVALEEVQRFLGHLGWRIPAELQEFWAETGGGDLFETETLLKIRGDPSLGDDLLAANEHFQALGLPIGLRVFHTGLGISAIREVDGHYLLLDPKSFHVVGIFPTFDQWYRSVLRSEYAVRYGLPAATASSH